MKLSRLTLLILELNAVVDAGAHVGVSFDEAKGHIDAGDVMPWLRARFHEQFQYITYNEQDDREITECLQRIDNAYGGEEGKWLIKNSGVCLLLAWVNEIIQMGGWEPDEFNAPEPPPGLPDFFDIVLKRRSMN